MDKVAVVSDVPLGVEADRPVDVGIFIPIKPIARNTGPKAIIGRIISCYKCGQPGGTLVKDDKGYRHAEGQRCKSV